MRRLPLMKNFEEAEALCQKEKEPFYLAAFLIQCWLGGLVQRATAEYSEKKNAKERVLQSGEAWRGFLELFGQVTTKGFGYMLFSLFRFCASDDSPGNPLRRALVPLSIEHDCTGDYFGPKTEHLMKGSRPATQAKEHAKGGKSQLSDFNELARRSIVRWCDWLDAAVHLRTHRRWHTAPSCFGPDAESRDLAALGEAQRHLAELDERAQACWVWDFAHAAQKYSNSPKWALVGQAMSDDSDRLWSYAEVDTLVIALWPLVKAYNWTYRDLLKTIRPGLKRSEVYPCEREQEFATYCVNVLGLRKATKGLSAKNGRPVGHEIAKRFCPPLRPGGSSSCQKSSSSSSS